jgi:hypothetical protein
MLNVIVLTLIYFFSDMTSASDHGNGGGRYSIRRGGGQYCGRCVCGCCRFVCFRRQWQRVRRKFSGVVSDERLPVGAGRRRRGRLARRRCDDCPKYVFGWISLSLVLLSATLFIFPFHFMSMSLVSGFAAPFIFLLDALPYLNLNLRHITSPFATHALIRNTDLSAHTATCLGAFFYLAFVRDDPTTGRVQRAILRPLALGGGWNQQMTAIVGDQVCGG